MFAPEPQPLAPLGSSAMTQLGKCQCGPCYQDGIRCVEKNDEMISVVLSCYCVTESKSETYLGLCFCNCDWYSNDSKYPNIYHKISDKTDMNEYMCGPFNRTGISCSKCAEEPSLLIIS